MSVPTWFARTVFRTQEALMQRPTFALLAELEKSQWLAPDAMREYQTHKLNGLLQCAVAHSPWHAARLQSVGLIDAVRSGAVALSDLPRLPTMNKRDARENVNQLVWRGVPGGAFSYTTGGSSGEPLIFYFGRSRQAADAAGRLRARRWWGMAPGDREVYLWGAPVELSKTDHVKTLRDRMVNQLLLNAFEMSPARMDKYLTSIQAWNPKAMYGYASSLALLAAHAESIGVRPKLPALRVVNATGEPLFPHQRELIERVFGVPVAIEYGARDAGLMALQSPDGSLLQMSETHLIEVLDDDGNPVEEGEAVITSLVSEAQPFIRYRTGDVVRYTGQADSGGRSLAVLDTVVGRQTDFVVAADGRIMHALAVIYVLRAIPGVGQFKLIQHAINQMEVQVVADDRWSDAARRAVIEGLQQRLGAELAVDLKLLNTIAPEASGKHRYVVSHVPLQNGLAQAVLVSSS